MLAILAVTLWLRRFDIRSPWPRNPDEGDLLAAARRAAQSLVPYDRFTTTSYGPLWPLGLGLLNRLGLPLTMTGAHLVATVLMAAVLCGFHLLLSRLVGRWPSFLTVLAMTIVWSSGGMPHHGDYQSLATEIGPLAAMMLGLVLLGTDRLSTVRVASAMVCFGAMPLLKYQFGYMALVAAGLALVEAWRRGPLPSWARLATWAGCLGLPTVLVVFATVLGGNGSRLLDEAATVIGTHFNNERTSLSSRLSETVTMLLGHPFFLLPLVLAATTTTAVTLHRRRNVLFPVGFVLALAAAVPSLVVLPRLFTHYSYLILASSALAVAWGLSGARPHLTTVRTATRSLATTTGAAALLLAVAYSHAPLNDPVRVQLAGPWSQVLTERPLDFTVSGTLDDALADACPAGSSVYVWGWAAEIYSFYDWEPASRYTIGTWFTSGTNDKSGFERRLREEFHGERPDCVVEAIGDGFFGGFSTKTTLAATVPGMGRFLRMHYEPRTISYLGNPYRPTMTIHVATSTIDDVRATAPIDVATTPIGWRS